jgi:hypothetical protein
MLSASHSLIHMFVALFLTSDYLALQQDSSGGMIRLPSRMIHIDKVCPIKKAGTAGIAATAGSLPTESPGRSEIWRAGRKCGAGFPVTKAISSSFILAVTSVTERSFFQKTNILKYFHSTYDFLRYFVFLGQLYYR